MRTSAVRRRTLLLATAWLALALLASLAPLAADMLPPVLLSPDAAPCLELAAGAIIDSPSWGPAVPRFEAHAPPALRGPPA